MKKPTKCFWLYVGSVVLAGVTFCLLARFDAGEIWSLSLLPACVLAWAGLAVWRDIRKEQTARSSRLFCADRFLYGLPIGLTLCIVVPLMA